MKNFFTRAINFLAPRDVAQTIDYPRVKIKYVVNRPELTPVYATPGAAGADVCSDVDDFVLYPGQRRRVRTGVWLAIPVGYEVQVRTRSGLADKRGLIVLNSPGTLDSDYRGEVEVLLFNAGRMDQTIVRGQRVAQLVVAPVVRGVFDRVEQLDDTTRGDGGFGSTGC